MKVNYYGVLDSPSGYGKVARETGLALRRLLGHKVGVINFPSPWGSVPITDPEMDHFLCEGQDYYKGDVDIGVAFSIPETLRHISPEREYLKDVNVRHWILHTAFEGTCISDEWASAIFEFEDTMGGLSCIIVPCQANVDAFKSKLGHIPTYVVPHGLSQSFRGLTYQRKPRTSGKTTFLMVFDWNTCWRKGIDILLEAYCAEFDPKEPVQLILKTGEKAYEYVPKMMRKILPMYGRQYSPILTLLTKSITESQLVDLYKLADCYVAPFRAEAVSLPIMEAMASAMPVIATNFDGPKEYLSDEYAFLIEPSSMISAKSEGGFYTNAYWAQPSIAQLRRYMRFIHENPEAGIGKGKEARKAARKLFDWNRSAKMELEIYRKVVGNNGTEKQEEQSQKQEGKEIVKVV